MPDLDVTVCLASIPPRAAKLRRALSTVVIQTLQPAAIVVEYDHEHTGAAATKNRALAKASTEWIATLDDDDQMLPTHLERLASLAGDADVIYSVPAVNGGQPDSIGMYYRPFDAEELRARSCIPTTALIRTKLIQATGGYQTANTPGSGYDDWGCWLALLDAGARFVHLPEQTWIWNIDGGNTSGDPRRWQ